jgi:photosystem II stability/assembly factor-like uncharacterized protein
VFISTDAGKSWKMIGKDLKFAAVGIFDDNALVTTKGDGILRSTDAGQTWTKASELQPVGRVMAVFDKTAYWVGKSALLVSKDKGATWSVQGSPIEAGWGPFFGKQESHIIVAGKKGFLETTDAGQTWTNIAPLPPVKDFGVAMPGWFLNFAWDPTADILYASRMGQATYKLERK